MDYFSGWCQTQRRLDNITAIVTGGNAGIGKQTVLDFYKRGERKYFLKIYSYLYNYFNLVRRWGCFALIFGKNSNIFLNNLKKIKIIEL